MSVPLDVPMLYGPFFWLEPMAAGARRREADEGDAEQRLAAIRADVQWLAGRICPTLGQTRGVLPKRRSGQYGRYLASPDGHPHPRVKETSNG
ncbi:hypothetical protein [Nonomuraea sp. NPDC049400]|uniref:hypothetical protein n=1 Tax=Nonomuraea sp. NPDC049400 TaxID=3364352 RepID=UPI0037AB3BCF